MGIFLQLRIFAGPYKTHLYLFTLCLKVVKWHSFRQVSFLANPAHVIYNIYNIQVCFLPFTAICEKISSYSGHSFVYIQFTIGMGKWNTNCMHCAGCTTVIDWDRNSWPLDALLIKRGYGKINYKNRNEKKTHKKYITRQVLRLEHARVTLLPF